MIANPVPAALPPFLDPTDDPDMTGPTPGTLLPCGCHIRRPDYEAVLCTEHLGELNRGE